MATETKVIIDMDQKGIEITCKHCGESQTYTMRSKEIPTRPKTQCQNCEKWIYIDREVLVKKFGQKDLVKKDQRKENLDITNQEERAKEPQKTKEKRPIELTKTIDQKPTNNDQKIIRSVGNIHTPERNKERLYDIYFKTDTIENLAKKYEIPKDYLNKIKNKLKKLKYPPRIEDNKLVCYQCGKENEKRLIFHHNHKTNEYIALVCDSCNQKLENNESVIYPLQDNTKKVERLETINNGQQKRGERFNIDFTNGMAQDISIYNQTIPINIKQEITHWVLNNLDLLYKGAYYYSKAWESRYKKRLKDEPDSPVITDFHEMQKIIDKIKELKKYKDKLESTKKKVNNNSKS